MPSRHGLSRRQQKSPSRFEKKTRVDAIVLKPDEEVDIDKLKEEIEEIRGVRNLIVSRIQQAGVLRPHIIEDKNGKMYTDFKPSNENDVLLVNMVARGEEFEPFHNGILGSMPFEDGINILKEGVKRWHRPLKEF